MHLPALPLLVSTPQNRAESHLFSSPPFTRRSAPLRAQVLEYRTSPVRPFPFGLTVEWSTEAAASGPGGGGRGGRGGRGGGRGVSGRSGGGRGISAGTGGTGAAGDGRLGPARAVFACLRGAIAMEEIVSAVGSLIFASGVRLRSTIFAHCTDCVVPRALSTSQQEECSCQP